MTLSCFVTIRTIGHLFLHASFLPSFENVDDTEGNGDDEEYGEGDVMDEWGGVHELVELRHTEDAEQQANQIDGDVTKGLNQEEIDEKLHDFVICLEPFHIDGLSL